MREVQCARKRAIEEGMASPAEEKTVRRAWVRTSWSSSFSRKEVVCGAEMAVVSVVKVEGRREEGETHPDLLEQPTQRRPRLQPQTRLTTRQRRHNRPQRSTLQQRRPLRNLQLILRHQRTHKRNKEIRVVSSRVVRFAVRRPNRRERPRPATTDIRPLRSAEGSDTRAVKERGGRVRRGGVPTLENGCDRATAGELDPLEEVEEGDVERGEGRAVEGDETLCGAGIGGGGGGGRGEGEDEGEGRGRGRAGFGGEGGGGEGDEGRRGEDLVEVTGDFGVLLKVRTTESVLKLPQKDEGIDEP